MATNSIDLCINFSQCRPLDGAELDRLQSSPEVLKTFAQRDTLMKEHAAGEISDKEFTDRMSALKKGLPGVCFQGHSLTGNRKMADMALTGLYVVDFDHVPDPRTAYEAQVKPRIDELEVLLAFVTFSNEGLKVVAPLPTGMSLQQAQQRLARLTGLEDYYDGSGTDKSRLAFIWRKEDELFRSERLFGDFSSRITDPRKQSEAHTRPATTAPRGESETQGASQVTMKNPSLPYDPALVDPLPPLRYEGREYAWGELLSAYWTLKEGLPAEGCRNIAVHEFNKGIRLLTDYNPELMMKLQPCVGLAKDELRHNVESSLRYKAYNLPPVWKLALKNLQRDRLAEQEALQGEPEGLAPYEIEPRFPKTRDLPEVLQTILRESDPVQHPYISTAVFPPLSCYLPGTAFEYIDRSHLEATMMTIITGDQSSGKGAIKPVVNHLIKPLRDMSMQAEQALKEWKDAYNSCPANKQKPPRPQVYNQTPAIDITPAAFVELTRDCAPRRLFFNSEELESLDKLAPSKNGDSRHFCTLLCKNFDPENTDGQARQGTQSVSATITVRFSCCISGTTGAVMKYFQPALTTGVVTRLNIAKAKEREIGAPIPMFGNFDADYDKALAPILENMKKAPARMTIRPAIDMARKLLKECQDIAIVTQNRTYETLMKRAVIIAFLKGCLLYIASGFQWDKRIETYCRWALQDDLYLKMSLFGDAIETAERYNKLKQSRRRGGKATPLDALPEQFTLEQVKDIVRDFALLTSPPNMIKSWKSRGMIRKVGDKLYQRTKRADDLRNRYVKQRKTDETDIDAKV